MLSLLLQTKLHELAQPYIYFIVSSLTQPLLHQPTPQQHQNQCRLSQECLPVSHFASVTTLGSYHSFFSPSIYWPRLAVSTIAYSPVLYNAYAISYIMLVKQGYSPNISCNQYLRKERSINKRVMQIEMLMGT